jgi:LacI family transcriptional regulator
VIQLKTTAKDIAAALGLSEAAVSMALNDKPGVSTATRRKILSEAKRRGYDFTRKAAYGNELRGSFCFAVYKKSGAVVGDTPFFSDLTDGISAACKKAHFDLVIRYLYEDEELDNQLYLLSKADFKGIILLATEMDAASLSRFSRIGIPVLLLDSYFETASYNCVIINNIQGAYLAASYLIKKTRTQPGYLRSAYSIGNFEERADGFYKAIRANGMSTSKSLVHRLTPSQDGAYADMKQLLENGEIPARCYFADNDHIAIGAMKALKEAGYRIPEDVALIGFDDIPHCAFMDPPLTTVQVPKHIMGKTAIRRLIEMIEQKDAYPIKIEIGTSLIIRRSV